MTFDNSSVSELLVNARKELGVSIEDVASDICVQARYLKAMETGEFDKLPEHTFAIGFLRSYASALGLNACDIVNAFKEEMGVQKPAELEIPNLEPIIAKSSSRGLPSWLSPVVGLAGAAAVWMWMSGGMASLSYSEAYDARVEEAQLAAVTAKLEQSPIINPVVTEKTETTPQTDVLPATRQQTDVPQTVQIEDSLTSSAASLFMPAANAAEINSGKLLNSNLFLEAVEDSWVRIANADGTEIWSGILKEGQSYRPEASDVMLLSTSNAGGIMLSIGGANAELLGTRGVIVTDMKLDLANSEMSSLLNDNTASGSR